MSEQEILDLIQNDAERMIIIKAVSSLNLTDWWVGAGFVRNKVWEHLFGNDIPTKLNDVDVAYWKSLSEYGMPESEILELIQKEESNPVWDEENKLSEKLRRILPEYEFEVKNQARMHISKLGDFERQPYNSAAEAIGDWVETATSVGVRTTEEGSLLLLAVHGIEDLGNGIVRPIRIERRARALERAESKGWFSKWPGLRFEEPWLI
ncbi:MAG: hypothetical protein AB203_01555 [Parcubacteria bacterium C7867-008]|nr:MAG: hypothetical protein AB203_01555 [Parcubacteria bacterium C7867-008]